MLNMFGRDYEEVGSSNRGLILKNSGKIKIQWGKTFIDLLDNKGNLNSKLRGFVKSVSSEEEVGKNEAGYVSQSKKFVFNIDDEVVSINSDQDAYVSFLEVQNKSENEKLQALQNIGFVYNSIEDTNKYPMNGIIYIVDEQSLYIVDNGTLSKYQVEFPNPYPKQFVIAKEFQNEEGALVIQGEGTSNSLKFNNLKIYSNNYQSVLDSEDEVVFRIRNSPVITINQDKTIIENGLTSDQNTFYSTIFDKKEDSTLPQYSSELETELREHYLDPDYDNVIPTLGVIRDMIGTGGGGDTNIIEVVKVNNTALVPDTNKAVNIEVPTKTSDLTNDSNFLTSFTETDPTVPSWAKASTKPSYTASEVGALPDTYTAPVTSVNGQTGAVSLTIPSAVTESTVSSWGFTKNTGTITGITMNGASKGTSGVVNLGTVITEHQDISGKANDNAVVHLSGNENISGNKVFADNVTINGSNLLIDAASTIKYSAAGTETDMRYGFAFLNSLTSLGQVNIVPFLVPRATASDNGKMAVVDGDKWSLITPVKIYSGSSAPSSSTGVNGDIYIQTT